MKITHINKVCNVYNAQIFVQGIVLEKNQWRASWDLCK